MPCYKPVKCFRVAGGGIVFTELARYDIIGDSKIPCGQCIGCRLDRAREWSVRCLHEAKMHEHNWFITLTYDEANKPENGSLRYRDFQLFMKKLRVSVGKVRFFMCGEYGESTARPHYRAIMFGLELEDLKEWGKSPTGHQMYRSELVGRLWGLGNVLIGGVSRQSAGYVARYCLKKVTGDIADAHYKGREPEFARMSLKPGIGAGFFLRYRGDILPCDYVIEGGMKIPVPKYYDKLYEKENEESLEEVKFRREVYGRSKGEDNSEERLKVREEVAYAKIRSLSRSKVE